MRLSPRETAASKATRGYRAWLLLGGMLLVCLMAAPQDGFAEPGGRSTSVTSQALAEADPIRALGQVASRETLEEARKAHELAQARAQRAESRARLKDADRRFNPLRTVIAIVGLALYFWGFWLRGEQHAHASRIRLVLLCVVGLSAYASFYQFFALVHAPGFRTPDNFHYYVGSKYFSELGYFGLYECSLHSITERGLREVAPDQSARDLRTMSVLPAGKILERGRDCPERFGEERWKSFEEDVWWFIKAWRPEKWHAVWNDYGYHPTPIWTLIGCAIASHAPTSNQLTQIVLSRIDRILVALGLLAIAWAFGLEIAALAAILWGTGFLWRYAFVGDAFLRHLWWIAMVLGICLLRRGHPALAGASLCLSTLLRIFPGAVPLGFILRSGHGNWQSRRLSPTLLHFLLGALIAGIILICLSAVTNGRGLEAFFEFAAKISNFASLDATNKMGLGVVARWLFEANEPPAQLFTLTAQLLFAVILWLGLRQSEEWEAAALGLTLIPVLTQPTNYYFSFIIAVVVLAVRRPRIGVVLLLAGIAWNVNGMLFYRQYAEYWYASIIAVVMCFWVALEMARPAPRCE